MGDIRLTPNTDFFVIPQSCGSYGARIFVRSALLWEKKFLHDFMKEVCCWGGHDKSWSDETSREEFYGFELPMRLSENACLLAFCEIFNVFQMKEGKHLA